MDVNAEFNKDSEFMFEFILSIVFQLGIFVWLTALANWLKLHQRADS